MREIFLNLKMHQNPFGSWIHWGSLQHSHPKPWLDLDGKAPLGKGLRRERKEAEGKEGKGKRGKEIKEGEGRQCKRM